MTDMHQDLASQQPVAMKTLQNSLQKDRVAHAYLFEGGRGTGKKAMALFLAKGLFCRQPHQGEPCHSCEQCRRIDQGNHPDVHVIEPDGQSIKKEQVRLLQEEFSKTGMESMKKAYIISGADKMTVQAANSLLKFLEEPHPSTTAILLTEQIHQMLPTILSRCQHVSFRPLTPVLFKEKLIAEDVHPTMASLVSKLTNQVDEAIELSDDEWFVQARKIMLKLYEVLKDDPFEAMIRVQSDYLPHFKEKSQIDQSLDLFLLIYKDLLYIQTDKLDHLSYPDWLDTFRTDALQTSANQLTHQLTVILEAKTQLQRNMNTQLLMEQLMLKLQGDLHLYEVVGVRFNKAGKIYYFDPNQLSLNVDEYVIVETVRGVEYGKVVTEVKKVDKNDVVLPLKKIVRIAEQKDRLSVQENKEEAAHAYKVCSEKISEHDLDMKLVDVEYTFDRNKVIFYFTADGRVDFRNLVKDLASVFRTRIELRQIGVRDEAKMLGGIGPCGRMLCCSTFLGDFEPVSIKMAKDQNLSLNPAKISGLCGRLMCCLKYENDEYEQAKEEMPDLGAFVQTPEGKGKVVGLNMLERVLQIEMKEQDRTLEYTLEEIMNHDIASIQATE